MENTNIILAGNIKKHRKQSGLTQEELAENLGVTFQAVSKWENAKSSPDINFLPLLADIFKCSIDALFSHTTEMKNDYDYFEEITWDDDDVIRGVVFEGRKVKKITDDLKDRFIFVIEGKAKSVESNCDIEVKGSVSGGCSTKGSVNIGGNLSGGCNTFGSVNVEGNFSGGCNTTGSINVGGSCFGDINSGGKLNISGNVDAERIKGNVVCNFLKCDCISGDVTIKSSNE